MLKFRGPTLNEIENARNAVIKIDKERRRNILTTKKMYNYVWDEEIKYGWWTDITSALQAIEQVREYVMKHQATNKDYQALLKYIPKSDALWNQNFNDHIQRFKFVDGELVYNV
jgi:hypothetical protein